MIVKEAVATVTSKGQVTIPVDVRRHLGICDRDKVIFTIDEDGTVRVKAHRFPTIESITRLSAALPRPMTKQEMIEIAHEDQVVEPFRKKLERWG